MDSNGTGRKGGKSGAWILFFFCLAAGLRLFGNRYGLPWIEEPDLDSIVLARNLSRGTAGLGRLLEPTRYPHLFTLVLVPVFKLFPDASIVWVGRILSGLLGAGCVAFTFLCADRAGGRRAAILASFMTAFSFLQVQHAHLAKPHVPVAFFTTACLYYCMRLMEKPDLRGYLLAGVFGGLALATLNTGFIVLAALMTAVAAAPAGYGCFFLRRYLSRGTLLAAGLVALFFLLGYANRVAALVEILMGNAEWRALTAPHSPSASSSMGWMGLAKFVSTFFQYDPWIGILGAAALLAGIWKRPRWWRLCLPGWIMTLLFIAVFGHIRAFVPRFLILILPFLSVASAVLVDRMISRIKPKAAGWVFAGASLLIVAPGAAAVIKLEWLYTRDDTRLLAAQWIQENVDPSVPLAASPYQDFPLPLTRASIEDHRRVLKNLPRWEEDDLKTTARGDVDPMGGNRYSVLFTAPDWKTRKKEINARMDVKKKRASAIVDRLKEEGVKYGIAVFYGSVEFRSPYYNLFFQFGDVIHEVLPGPKGHFGGNLYSIPSPLLRIWSIERPGPLVMIVKLNRLFK